MFYFALSHYWLQSIECIWMKVEGKYVRFAFQKKITFYFHFMILIYFSKTFYNLISLFLRDGY